MFNFEIFSAEIHYTNFLQKLGVSKGSHRRDCANTIAAAPNGKQKGATMVFQRSQWGRVRSRSCRRLRAQERQMANFQFWHDRLVILKQLFDESQPSDLKMAWYDRRNGVQWYTFWVAILILFLTIFFGCIQSVEGALQVYLGYRALVQHN